MTLDDTKMPFYDNLFLRLLAGLLWVAFKDKVKANIDTVIPLAKNCSLRTVAYADIIDMVLT